MDVDTLEDVWQAYSSIKSKATQAPEVATELEETTEETTNLEETTALEETTEKTIQLE